MKPKSQLHTSSHLLFPSAIAACVSLILQASAANVTWDLFEAVPSNGTVTGGTGAWDTITTNRTTDSGLSNIAWNNAAKKHGRFQRHGRHGDSRRGRHCW